MKSIELDYGKRCADEPSKGHNRWHPDIPPAVEADPGEEVVMQTRNAFDGEVTPNSTNEDLRSPNLGVVHPLTGPVYVKGAEPGDLLECNILNVEPANWGFTTIIPGFGFLRGPVHRALRRPLEHRRGVRRVGAASGSAHPRGAVHGGHRSGPLQAASQGYHRPGRPSS